MTEREKGREPCAIGCGLLLDADAERFHLAVEVAAFETEALCGATYIAMALVNLLQDIVAFVGLSRFEQSGELFAACGGFAGVAVDEHGQVLALDALDLRVQDQDALDEVA